ncbi:uncharacterized protein TRIREDRAFT_112459 [Trichoderma reesei QM6a]|uniref:Predicted protein n=2 Tax=Hypocrea jecorina TaxID=51453 RepID=G0RX43_HYPJQ|nr:uncharacterized protein TRIREDRAFT_112459 [Trichoderma reesei QM6a]EGR44245.1 predicted protein [Trichoderma reesei QM6a]ETR96892.1 hypothetical protein M419DRAFT_39848 [Trichoderma reesei RUT C-30]
MDRPISVKLGNILAAIDQIEAFLGHIFYALSCAAMPGFWVETLIFRMLGLNTQTGFRMFPPADVVSYLDTTLAYSYSLIMVMCIPYFLYMDQPSRSGPLGRMLRPLTTRVSPSLQFCIMLVRVWLAAAWINSGAVQFMIDHVKWKLAWRYGSLILIL